MLLVPTHFLANGTPFVELRVLSVYLLVPIVPMWRRACEFAWEGLKGCVRSNAVWVIRVGFVLRVWMCGWVGDTACGECVPGGSR